MNFKEVGNGRGIFWPHVETGCLLYAWGIEVLRLINGGPQLFNKSCFRSVNFVVVVFVVVVQEEEQTKEGSKPRHGIWN